MIRGLLHVLIVIWWASEIALAVRTRRRARAPSASSSDLRWIWVVIAISTTAALVAQRFAAPRLPLPDSWIAPLAVALMVIGLAIRWTAILTLGRLFSVHVTFQDEHVLVRHGMYGVIRHPSYTGMLLSFLGFGIALGNWLSLVLAVVPVTLVFMHRIRNEERFLLERFGTEYEEYRKRTKRLIPFVY